MKTHLFFALCVFLMAGFFCNTELDPPVCQRHYVLRGEIPIVSTDAKPLNGTVISTDTCILDEHCDPGWRCNASQCEQQYVIR